MMKTKIIITFVALMMAGSLVSAQTSMKGRVYHNPNIMASVLIIDGKDRDTLTVSTDGKTLTGYYDKDTKFMLKRTK